MNRSYETKSLKKSVSSSRLAGSRISRRLNSNRHVDTIMQQEAVMPKLDDFKSKFDNHLKIIDLEEKNHRVNNLHMFMTIEPFYPKNNMTSPRKLEDKDLDLKEDITDVFFEETGTM
jgi:hypothetical protein